MTLRFQKRKKVLPGTSVNLSKASASVSTGVRGARLSLGRRGIRGSVGIPGTGVSLTSLGIGRMGGFGAVVALVALLVLATLQAVWLLVKISMQVTFWTIRGLINIVGMSVGAIQRMKNVKQKSKPNGKGLTPSRSKPKTRR
jgi:hypothetical protein